jgi:16S rRNA (cytosine1402-N4)-methyltransferase
VASASPPAPTGQGVRAGPRRPDAEAADGKNAPVETPGHIPVLLQEVLAALGPRPGEVYADATAGLGGHASSVARRLGPSGTVVLNDADPANLARAGAGIAALGSAAPRVLTIRGNFADLPRRLSEAGLAPDMLLADLGFASTQVDDAARGFSFRHDGPLDMRMDTESPVTAAELVNTLPERELAGLIRDFGEEKNARTIASKLVAARARGPILSTARLAEIVRSAFGGRDQRIDPATRTFQALRIAVNDEIGSLESLLRSVGQAAAAVAAGRPAWLNPGARVAIIGFHSLEDRPVKRAFADLAAKGLASLDGRRAVRASESEVEDNARARSARLRAIRLGRAVD